MNRKGMGKKSVERCNTQLERKTEKSDETLMAINGLLQFIEANVKNDFSKEALEQATGMTYHTARQFFKQHTGISLKSYMDSRKIAHAALELQNGEKSATDISCDYGFAAYDTFTRCFKRECGVTPSQFRKDHSVSVSMGLIAMGIYGPVLMTPGRTNSFVAPKSEPGLLFAAASDSADLSDLKGTANIAEAPDLTESAGTMNLAGPAALADSKVTGARCVLYGVPKVEFSSGKCVPFNACLESALCYSGYGQTRYPYLMAASGASFRFCWNPGKWDPSVSDLRNLNPEDPYRAFVRAVRAAGRSCSILKREDAGKETFIEAVRESVAKGTAVIGFGIVGPPEACLITGYEDGGETLLGWSYFQENPEFASALTFCDNGYYRCDNWWENPYTTALLVIGEQAEYGTGINEIFREAATIMESSQSGAYLFGDSAYEAWADDLLTDSYFLEGTVLPVLAERFLSQSDAETMLTEGRYWAGEFFKQLAQIRGRGKIVDEADAADLEKQCLAAADHCFRVSELGKEMTAARKGLEPGEEAVYLLCDRSVRENLAGLIRQVRTEERMIREVLGKLAG